MRYIQISRDSELIVTLNFYLIFLSIQFIKTVINLF